MEDRILDSPRSSGINIDTTLLEASGLSGEESRHVVLWDLVWHGKARRNGTPAHSVKSNQSCVHGLFHELLGMPTFRSLSSIIASSPNACR